MTLALSLGILMGACIGLGWWARGAADWARHRLNQKAWQIGAVTEFDAGMARWTRATKATGWLQ